MTRLAWDKSGERIYQTGVDRGVLYVPDDDNTTYRGVPWNGLTAIDQEEEGLSQTPLYFDGEIYQIARALGDFQASMKAYTYPEEFEQFEGTAQVSPGLFAYNQPVRKQFGLSYRTKIGNDIQGLDLGYKIHLCYKLSAIPDTRSFGTMDQQNSPSLFGWTIQGVPMPLSGHRPTAHLVLDTRYMDPLLVEYLERVLYGDEANDPRLPSPEEIKDLITNWSLITIIDNGDGTWTAVGPDANVHYRDAIEEFVDNTFYDQTYFIIEGGDATFIDSDTYRIKSN